MKARELDLPTASLFPTTEGEYGVLAVLLATSLARSPARSPPWINAVEIAINRLIGFIILIGFALIGEYRYGVAASMVNPYRSPVLMTVAILRWCIFFLAAGATIAISVIDPRVVWGGEFGSFLLAAFTVWRTREIRRSAAIPLAAIAVWGFVQLAFGATVDGYATLDASLRMAAFAATFLASATLFSTTPLVNSLLAALARFGFVAAILGVLAYYTSPGKILWIFPSPYPDSWGFFLSRNNFAQFLELALPAALWRARFGTTSAILIGAGILAAGIASASRAGAILLLLETLVCLMLLRRVVNRTSMWKSMWTLAVASVAFIAIAGATQLWSRFHAPDPFEYRREFVRSTLAMIAEHPSRGFGLGSFASVYPAFAEFDPGAAVTHAHNDWLEWSSEGGVPFAAAWFLLAIGLLRPAVRSVWGIGIVAVLLHALVDFPFARFGIGVWFFVVAGALSREKGRVMSFKCGAGTSAGNRTLGRFFHGEQSRLKATRRHEWRPHVETDPVPKTAPCGE